MGATTSVGKFTVDMSADPAKIKSDMAQAVDAVQASAKRMVEELDKALNPLQSISVRFGTLESMLNNAQSAALSLGKSLVLGAAAGMSIDAIASKITGVISGMAHLKEQSEKTGASVESMPKAAFFSKAAGSDLDGVTNAIVKLGKGMAGADDETKGAGRALSFLGLSAKDAAGHLKDPAQLFQEIGFKLDGYRDGAGKAAIAQELFGKAGADMLPTLKLMAELGDIEAKVTTEQAEAARVYELDLKRLDAQKNAVFRTVSVALLPSMKDFVEMLIDASKQTNILNDNAKKLANDHSIEGWADRAAMGIAWVIDTFSAFAKVIQIVGKAWAAQMALGATFVDWLSSPMQGKGVDMLVNGWNSLKTRMGAVWDGFKDDANGAAMSYTSYADALKKRIEARQKSNNELSNEDARALLHSNAMYGELNKQNLDYSSSTDKADKARLSAQAIDSLEKATQRKG
jgi:hypothetical protein